MADEPYLVVRTSVSDHPAGGEISSHAHDWHQLVHVRAGLVTVRTAAGTWVAPPTWAVWVPAGTVHAVRFVVPSALRTAYLRSDLRVPGGCRAFAVSTLLRELLVRVTGLGMLDERDPGTGPAPSNDEAEVRLLLGISGAHAERDSSDRHRLLTQRLGGGPDDPLSVQPPSQPPDGVTGVEITRSE